MHQLLPGRLPREGDWWPTSEKAEEGVMLEKVLRTARWMTRKKLRGKIERKREKNESEREKEKRMQAGQAPATTWPSSPPLEPCEAPRPCGDLK